MSPMYLLSDEFVEFSKNVSLLHDKKKEAVAAFRSFYEKHKAELKAIDDQAAQLNADFEKWKTTQEKTTKPVKE